MPLTSAKANLFTVKEPAELLPFLMQCLQGISRTRAKAILSGQGVEVDGRVQTRHDLPLRPGQQVAVSRRKPGAQIESKFVRLVWEDQHLIVVEKAPGILSMATSHHAFCVKTVLDDYFRRSRQRCTAHVVHRLDRDTSGLLVYAKTIEAEQLLEHNWHDMVTDRRYQAVVSGCMPQKSGTRESWLKDNKAYITYSSPQDPGGGKFAVTHWRVLRSGPRYSLLELRLETGRKNQIRVHMQDLGHPVCGDTKYGDGSDPIGRLALHAFRLCLRHPITGEQLRFETPVPKAFLLCVKSEETAVRSRE